GVTSGVSGGNTVPLFSEHGPIRCDEHGAERLIARLQSLFGQLHAAAKMPHVNIGHHGSLLPWVVEAMLSRVAGPHLGLVAALEAGVAFEVSPCDWRAI